jgi:hypothetical protein
MHKAICCVTGSFAYISADSLSDCICSSSCKDASHTMKQLSYSMDHMISMSMMMMMMLLMMMMMMMMMLLIN